MAHHSYNHYLHGNPKKTSFFYFHICKNGFLHIDPDKVRYIQQLLNVF